MGVKVIGTIICEFVDCGHSEPVDVDVPWDGGYGASAQKPGGWFKDQYGRLNCPKHRKPDHSPRTLGR